MVLITKDIHSRFPNAFRKARNEKIKCIRNDVDLYFVARAAPGHGRYYVRFFETMGLNETKVKVQCRSVEGEPCRGMYREQLCAHAAKAIESGIKHGRKKQKQVVPRKGSVISSGRRAGIGAA